MKLTVLFFSLFLGKVMLAQSPFRQKQEALPVYAGEMQKAPGDWLLGNVDAVTRVFKSSNGKDLVISNGLISRKFRLNPYMACLGFRNLTSGKEMLRAIEPEAELLINGRSWAVGGVQGQFERGYIQYDWLERFRADDEAFRLVDFSIRDIQPRFPWKPSRWSTHKRWPPKGKEIDFTFHPPGNALPGITIDVCYEMYDGIPLLSKWLVVHNAGRETIRINSFESEKLAVVEESSGVDKDGSFPSPHICVQSDYAFGGGSYADANHTTRWLPDSLYSSHLQEKKKAWS
jgi:hypothetical protein